MKKRKNLAGLQKRKAISGYLFISPFILGFLGFMVSPMIRSFYMSLCEVKISAATINYIYTGLDNVKMAVSIDPEYNRLLTEELGRMCVNSLAIMVFSFFVALILNQQFKGRALVRAIFFLPVIMASGAIIGVEYNNSLLASVQEMVQESANTTTITDSLENILRTAGIGTRAFQQVFEIVDGIYDVALASGIQIIIFLSGLQTISASMYEAAQIEGCTAWESFWKITFPMISSLFLVNWIYTIVAFCMRTDNQVIEKIQDQMINFMDYGLASAMSWIYFLAVIAIIGVSALVISKGVYYYE